MSIYSGTPGQKKLPRLSDLTPQGVSKESSMTIYRKTTDFIIKHCMSKERSECPLSNDILTGILIIYPMSQLIEYQSIVQQVKFALGQFGMYRHSIELANVDYVKFKLWMRSSDAVLFRKHLQNLVHHFASLWLKNCDKFALFVC